MHSLSRSSAASQEMLLLPLPSASIGAGAAARQNPSRMSPFDSTLCVEKRKSTVYLLDVMVDSCGIVQESQCDCAAGMGPEAHCKHVCVVLITLTRVKGGIICLETCTQELQTFHHVTYHTGSPVKMHNMNLHPGGSLQRVIDLDPSPPEIPDDEYCENFRNVMVNLDALGLLMFTQLSMIIIIYRESIWQVL